MGCGSNTDDKKQGFLIQIYHPLNRQIQSFKYYDEKQKSDLIMNVMNGLCFSEKVNEKVDGNFVSIYDSVEDRYHYFVQRLIGIEIDDLQDPTNGKIWIPYINEKKQDWNVLVENNTRISINDHILWRLELFKKEKDLKVK